MGSLDHGNTGLAFDDGDHLVGAGLRTAGFGIHPAGNHIDILRFDFRQFHGHSHGSSQRPARAFVFEERHHLGGRGIAAVTLGGRGPVFSPDGDRVAFRSWDRSYRASLWMAELDGSKPVQLTKGGADMYPQFSPGGKRLLFESGRSGNMDIWVLELE